MPLVYLLLSLAVFWRLWTPIHGAERTWKYDPTHEYWGDLDFQAQTLSAGELALWNPYDRGGFPVYGDPQPGLFYPPNWPLVLAGSFYEQFPFWLTSLKILLHWIFGAIGMHLLLRRLGGGEPGSYVAGILFSFSSPKLRYMGSALNWSVAWIPWVLLSIAYFAEAPSRRRAVLMGTSIAMVLLSGAPAVVLYTLVLAIPFGIYKLWGRLKELLPLIAMGGLVSLLWILPLIAANLEQLPESVRQVRSFAFITDSVFTPGHFLTFLVPRLGQGENPYMGLLLVFAIAGAIGLPRHRPLALIFLGTAFFSIAISLGNHAGFLPSLSSAFSPFSLFRRAHRYLYINSAALSIVAGLGVGAILSLSTAAPAKLERWKRKIAYLGIGLSFALGVAYLVSVVVSDKLKAPKNIGLALSLSSAVGFTVLLHFALASKPRTARLLAALIPVFVFFDVWTANFPQVEQGLAEIPKTPNDSLVESLEGVDSEFRIYDDDLLRYRPGVRLQIRDFSGYEDDPLGLSRYTLLLNASKRDLRLLGHANVRYLLDGKGKLRGSKKMGTEVSPKVWELHKVAPAVFFVAAPVFVDTPQAAVAALKTLRPGLDAVIEGAPRTQTEHDTNQGPAAAVAGAITYRDANHLKAEITTPGPGWIVVNEAYYPNWHTTLDGQAVATVPANGMFRAIYAEGGGPHRIAMHISSSRFSWLLVAYALAWLALLWALGSAFVIRRSKAA